MGGAGMFSVSLILPMMGRWLDNYKQEAIAKGMTTSAADIFAGSHTFLKVAVMPAILLVVFVLIFIFKKKQSK
jgi:hypothetical protein